MQHIKALRNQLFSIDIIEMHWLENGDEADDRCAHGQVRVIIGKEIIVDKSESNLWNLSAMAIHLLRTLDTDHTDKDKIGGYLIPSEGHHIDHHENNPIVHIETAFSLASGHNWWVKHSENNVTLQTESNNSIVIPFDLYKKQILLFTDKVEFFYNNSKPKNFPVDQYDLDAYIKFWKEWKSMRNKWN